MNPWSSQLEYFDPQFVRLSHENCINKIIREWILYQ